VAGLYPTDASAEAVLDIAEIGSGGRFGQIHQESYSDPLSFAKSKSRFSDPRSLPEDQRFGVLYLGSTLKVCFIEAVLRDRRNGAVGIIRSRKENLRGSAIRRSLSAHLSVSWICAGMDL